MRAATTIREVDSIALASAKGRRINGLYRLMGNPDVLWKQAYANLYANKGATTKGVMKNSLDGFAEERVQHLIRTLNAREYHFSPVRRTYIPKRNGKMRPLGIPTGDDKLVQEVVRILLEQIYEPVFSKDSHGFRPGRSCHTALSSIKHTWTGMKWIIEFDIKGFFDNINHDKLIAILKKKINDKRIINIIKMMLKSGYMEDWRYNQTYSGTPQGGVISPILANIYLHELDMFVQEKILSFNRGEKRGHNPEYRKMAGQLALTRRKIRRILNGQRVSEDTPPLSDLMQRESQQKAILLKTPYCNPFDQDYKRMRYIRYADDFVIGIIGSKQDAVIILKEVTDFLRKELHLEISEEKTGIRHAERGVQFLGYEVKTYKKWNRIKAVSKEVRNKRIISISRVNVGSIQLHVPSTRKAKFCAEHRYGEYCTKDVRAKVRPELMERSDAEILQVYNTEMRGFANYYSLATGYKKSISKLIGKAQYSFFATLAEKHKMKTSKMARKLRLSDGKGYGIKVVIRGIEKTYKLFRLSSHIRPKQTDIADEKAFTGWYRLNRTELIRRLNANVCEYCGKVGGYMEVHHIRSLKDIQRGKQEWQKQMSYMRRKTMVLCIDCHHELHGRGLPGWRQKAKANGIMESRVR